MKIYEYGNQNKSKILLIHGMWMTHEMMLPYVDQLMDDYHIIVPDLTDWLVQNGCFGRCSGK